MPEANQELLNQDFEELQELCLFDVNICFALKSKAR